MKRLVYKKSRRTKKTQVVVRHKISVTKGDLVRVVSGDDKGTEGNVLQVYTKTGRILVDGVNIVKKHKAATENDEGGIIEMPAPIHHSNVMLIDPKSGEPTRVRRKKDSEGSVERISVKSGQSIPRKV
jgi:large subunit ribosomal protein L24